jgi:hypothetical protein
MANKDKGFFKGVDGGRSSMRLVWIYTLFIGMTVWAVISLHNWKMEAMSEGFVLLMIAMSGTKVAQNMVEKGNLSLKIGDKGNPNSVEPKDPKKPKPDGNTEEPIKPPKE